MAGNYDYRICGLTKYKHTLSISECRDPKVGITFQPHKNPLGGSHLVARYHFKHVYGFETVMLLCELEGADSRGYTIF
jgi:hypothetical protein